MGARQPNFIVGIGGSAGSLSAFISFFETMPVDSGMAFIVVAHLSPIDNSLLDQILSRHTSMPVTIASSGMQIQINSVYVIPPNADLYVDNYILNVVSPPNRMSKQVDCLLISLAKSMGNHAVGIIFSGYLQDGTEGSMYIKAKGGITFAQDQSAEVSSMPLSAHASGCIDFVLPPEKMPSALLKL